MDDKEFDAIKKLFEKKNTLLDTTSHAHAEAHAKAVRENLMDGEEVNYSKLKDTDKQLAFVKTMSDHYLSIARKNLGVTETKGELEDNMLLQAYFGITQGTLRSLINQHRHNYNTEKHAETLVSLRKGQDERLSDVIYGKIGEKQIPGVVAYTKSGDLVDQNKMQLSDARGLLDMYLRNGVIPAGAVEGTQYAKKKDAGHGAHPS